jgi:uncharacterized membrane protein
MKEINKIQYYKIICLTFIVTTILWSLIFTYTIEKIEKQHNKTIEFIINSN